MDANEAYVFLLADSAMSSLLLPIKANLVFPLMKLFGGYNTQLMIILAAVGTTIGAIANWGLGRFIGIASKYNPKGERTIKFNNFLQKYGRWLLLFAWVPVLNGIIATGLGVVKIKLNQLVLLVLLVNIIYYTIWAAY